MGLDMYLEGHKHFMEHYEDKEKNLMEDGFRIKEKVLELGYWRKHPDLHGFIVQEFADGKDECQDIELTTEDLQKILKAVEGEILPHTEGFFFGASSLEDKDYTIDILKKAIKWSKKKEKDDIIKYVIYRASW